MKKEEKFVAISCMPEGERPYERMETQGASSLSDGELIAVIITSGTRNRTALDLARDVVSLCEGDLSNLRNISPEELKSIRGIGRVKALQLNAVCELGRRLGKRQKKRINCKNSDEIGEMLTNDMGQYTQEVFRTIVLDKKLRLIGMKDVFTGTVDTAFAHPRETFREAVLHLGSYVILAHNHPSGDVTPGRDDYATTKRMIDAGKILGIEVLDHIIVGNGSFYSMHKNGDMDRLKEEKNT